MKSKHLSYEERLSIEKWLKDGCSFKEIASRLDKSASTISREVRLHRIFKERNTFNNPNICTHRRDCNKAEHCKGKGCNRNQCSKCNVCNRYCDSFEEAVCIKLLRAPLVCNGCQTSQNCHFNKFYYDARLAQNTYKANLREKREGINMNEDEFARLSGIVCPLIEKKQSIASIVHNHKELECSPRTIYSYVEKGLFPVRNIDLPRKIRYRKRYSVKSEQSDPAWKTGRTFNDYKEYRSNPEHMITGQMDTVIGMKTGSQKVLLTLQRPDMSFLFAFLIEKKTQEEVKKALDSLERKIGKLRFQRLFPSIITDNGVEFKNPDLIENSVFGGKRTKVFYADPYSAFQKAAIENNHEMIRRFLPKGMSFNSLTDETVAEMINNINNYPRASLNWLSPYEKAKMILGPKILKELGFKKIKPDDVDLRPSLSKTKGNMKSIARKRLNEKK